MRGVFGIGNVLSIRDFDAKLFISDSQLNFNGGCSLVAERSVVVRMARVRFSASAFGIGDVEVIGIRK